MSIGAGRVTLALGFVAILALRVQAAAVQEAWEQPPDVILRLSSPLTIRAGSAPQIRRFELPALQVKDRWIRAVHFQPGEPSAVRGAFFYIDKTNNWIGSWVPGQKMVSFPETVAAYLPTGAKVILEIHYQSPSVDVRDSSAIALYFTDQKPLRPLAGMGVATPIQVPGVAGVFTLRREFTVIDDSYMLALRPEMQSAGRAMIVTAVEPSGTSQVIIDVRDFNRNDQRSYVFAQPFFVAKGTQIVATALYENGKTGDTEDLFKLSMSMYPSAESHPIVDQPKKAVPPRRVRAKRPVAKKPAIQKPAAVKKPPVAKAPVAKKP